MSNTNDLLQAKLQKVYEALGGDAGITPPPDVKDTLGWWLDLISDQLADGTGGAVVPDDYFFTDVTARDAYFSAHPDELKDGVLCCTDSPVALWKYNGTEWKNSSSWVKGPKGDKGSNIEIQNDNTYIQWRVVGADTWNNLVALSALHGADGRDGANGRDGTDGRNGMDGKDGDSVDIQVTETYIQWKHTSDTNWQNLIALSLLKGADGSNGSDGISIAWKGYLSSPPENPEINWAYYNSVDGKSYIWDGLSWNIMTQDGLPGGVSDYNDLTNKPAIDGLTLDSDSTSLNLNIANRINYPAIPFDGTILNVDPPYAIHFNTSVHPLLTPPAPGQPCLFGWSVYGHPLWLFGFFSNDGVTTKVGLFEVTADEIVEIDHIYDGTTWNNGGVWSVRYGIRSDTMQIGSLEGIDLAADITIPSLGTKDLIDIANQKQDKILTDLSEKNKVVVVHGDGGVDGITYELSTDLDSSERKIPNNKTVYQNILAEASNRQNADAALGSRLDRQEGMGGALTAHDFGTLTPTLENLLEYFCVGIWGNYDPAAGTFTWNSTSPKDSTYEIDDVTYTASEIFNNTWFRNTYQETNHRWVITNTPNTNPPAFTVTDVGVDTVGQATSSLAGIAKLYNEVENSNTDGAVTQAAVKTALAGKQKTLVSGTSIKTINNTPVLGSGDIAVIASNFGGYRQDFYNVGSGAQFTLSLNTSWGNNPRSGVLEIMACAEYASGYAQVFIACNSGTANSYGAKILQTYQSSTQSNDHLFEVVSAAGGLLTIKVLNPDSRYSNKIHVAWDSQSDWPLAKI
jgi:hypothetical protein